MVIAFNPDYLIDGVEAVDGDEVTLETLDALKPAVVRTGRGLRLPVPAHAGPGVLSPARSPDVRVDALWLTDFRNYDDGRARPAPGPHGGRRRQRRGQDQPARGHRLPGHPASFRGAPGEALVRVGRRVGGRAGRGRRRRAARRSSRPSCSRRAATGCMVNRQPLRRARDLLGTLRVSVFSPDDLALVKGGPAERRRLLDDTLVACAPRHDAMRADLDRVLRQRNTLLKQAGGRLTPEVGATLDVWDAKLAELGEDAGRRPGARWSTGWRRWWPRPTTGWPRRPSSVGARLRRALAGRRAWPPAWPPPAPDDLRRGVTHRRAPPRRAGAGARRPAGPHPRLPGRAALAGPGPAPGRPRAWSTEVAGSTPVLLLDDVFSELDPDRSAALLARPARRPGPAHHRRQPARPAPTPSSSCGSAAAACWRRRERRRPVEPR